MTDTPKAVFSCPFCCAVPPAPHKADCPELGRSTTTRWDTFKNPPAETIHSRMVGGVLCRWWGDGPEPAGVALIDATTELAADLEGQHAKNVLLAASLRQADEVRDELVAALKGVLRVADRKTDEFDAARAALKAAGEQP